MVTFLASDLNMCWDIPFRAPEADVVRLLMLTLISMVFCFEHEDLTSISGGDFGELKVLGESSFEFR